MALKPWLLRKIEQNEQELKYLTALLIMLTHVENAIVESESEYDTDIKDSDNSLNIGDFNYLMKIVIKQLQFYTFC